ncbi:DUF6538 domain-containing protein [Rhodosalinus sp.]|uniref:DUF6538 domain-containing protein n=1 Tax=Rhodosalinus sp. TaxID=2047741 RepID=UPI00397D6E91
MPANWFRYRTIYMKVRYVEWRARLTFFRRRIPRDLQKFYPGKRGEVFFLLQTRDPMVAAKKADLEARRLDAEWARLRRGEGTTAAVQTEALALLRKHGLAPGQWAEWQKHDLEPDSFIGELEAMAGVDGVDVRRIEPARLPPTHALAAGALLCQAHAILLLNSSFMTRLLGRDIRTCQNRLQKQMPTLYLACL